VLRGDGFRESFLAPWPLHVTFIRLAGVARRINIAPNTLIEKQIEALLFTRLM
jgi:hypothetical protein